MSARFHTYSVTLYDYITMDNADFVYWIVDIFGGLVHSIASLRSKQGHGGRPSPKQFANALAIWISAEEQRIRFVINYNLPASKI